MAKIKFKVVTPERTVIEENVYQATLPVEEGEVTLLPDHMPYIGALKAGEILLRKENGGEEENLATSGGFVEFHDNVLSVLADTAERAEEIDVARAEEARKRAEELNASGVPLDAEAYARTAALIERETARIRVARKHQSRRGITINQNNSGV